MSLDMTPAELAPYRAFWRKLAQAELTPEMRVAAEKARQEAERLAKILADEFGVERVYLFGSFAWGKVLRPDSDIDLAVEGLPPGKLIKADVRVSDATKYSVDLMRLSSLPTRLRNRVLKSGILLYERQSTPVAG
jgi:predicted nucleotidyltransferase